MHAIIILWEYIINIMFNYPMKYLLLKCVLIILESLAFVNYFYIYNNEKRVLFNLIIPKKVYPKKKKKLI